MTTDDYELVYVGDPYECTVTEANEFLYGAVSTAYTYLTHNYDNRESTWAPSDLSLLASWCAAWPTAFQMPQRATKLFSDSALASNRGVLDQWAAIHIPGAQT